MLNTSSEAIPESIPTGFLVPTHFTLSPRFHITQDSPAKCFRCAGNEISIPSVRNAWEKSLSGSKMRGSPGKQDEKTDSVCRCVNFSVCVCVGGISGLRGPGAYRPLPLPHVALPPPPPYHTPQSDHGRVVCDVRQTAWGRELQQKETYRTFPPFEHWFPQTVQTLLENILPGKRKIESSRARERRYIPRHVSSISQ